MIFIIVIKKNTLTREVKTTDIHTLEKLAQDRKDTRPDSLQVLYDVWWYDTERTCYRKLLCEKYNGEINVTRN